MGYEVKVEGVLDNSRADWFYGWEMTVEEESITLFTNNKADEATLHGLLAKIRNLNLHIISVNTIN